MLHCRARPLCTAMEAIEAPSMSGLVLHSVHVTHMISAKATDSTLELKREYSLSRNRQSLTSVSEMSPGTNTGCLDRYRTLKGGGRPPHHQACQPHEQLSGQLNTYKVVWRSSNGTSTSMYLTSTWQSGGPAYLINIYWTS